MEIKNIMSWLFRIIVIVIIIIFFCTVLIKYGSNFFFTDQHSQKSSEPVRIKRNISDVNRSYHEENPLGFNASELNKDLDPGNPYYLDPNLLNDLEFNSVMVKNITKIQDDLSLTKNKLDDMLEEKNNQSNVQKQFYMKQQEMNKHNTSIIMNILQRLKTNEDRIKLVSDIEQNKHNLTHEERLALDNALQKDKYISKNILNLDDDITKNVDDVIDDNYTIQNNDENYQHKEIQNISYDSGRGSILDNNVTTNEDDQESDEE